MRPVAERQTSVQPVQTRHQEFACSGAFSCRTEIAELFTRAHQRGLDGDGVPNIPAFQGGWIWPKHKTPRTAQPWVSSCDETTNIIILSSVSNYCVSEVVRRRSLYIHTLPTRVTACSLGLTACTTSQHTEPVCGKVRITTIFRPGCEGAMHLSLPVQ
jgi:hypothetical protein